MPNSHHKTYKSGTTIKCVSTKNQYSWWNVPEKSSLDDTQYNDFKIAVMNMFETHREYKEMLNWGLKNTEKTAEWNEKKKQITIQDRKIYFNI